MTIHPRVLAGSAVLFALGCNPTRPVDARPDPSVAPRVDGTRPSRVSVPRPRTQTAPAIAARPCEAPSAPVIAAGWTLEGYRPGPVLEDLTAVGHRGATMLGTTADALCVSGDGGESWGVAEGVPAGLAAPVVERLAVLERVVLIAQGTPERPAPPQVFRSREEPLRWEPVRLPPEAGARARAFTDGVRRLYVASPTQLWRSTDGEAFEGPWPLPGTESDGVDACGETLIARASVDREGAFHHSDDFGRTWRPFRLGILGLEGTHGTVLRCLGWGGGIEAGRAPLPGYWSFDQGRTWRPARYDLRAQRHARAVADDPRATAEAPHCTTGYGGRLVCMQEGRLVMPDADGPWDREHPVQHEIRGPAGCSTIRMLDDRRVAAFGRGCGLHVSHDLGGIWRAVMVSSDAAVESAPSLPGRGGFVTADVAWRVDAGLWWTTDGGAHWRIVPTRSGRSLSWGAFLDRDRGVFVQDDGWVVATSDGGMQWRFVTRGEVERVATSGPYVMVTTTERVWLSPDGGNRWRATATLPAGRVLDPVVSVRGALRWVDFPGGAKVEQRDGAVRARGAAAGEVTLAQGLPRRLELLAAHVTEGAVDRVLLSGGVMLRRGTRGRRGGSGGTGDGPS